MPYAPVGELNMYYEIHGAGRPLLLLHGAYMTIDAMGLLVEGLANIRRVVAVEQSTSSATAWAAASPSNWRCAIPASCAGSSSPRRGSASTACTPRRSPCSPRSRPSWGEKVKNFDITPFRSPEDEIRAISAPTLIILGDSDGIRLEHAVELFRLRGGGVMGDLSGIPDSQLAVLPGTTHFVPPGFGLMDRIDWLLAMIPPFLDPPPPPEMPGA